MLAFALFALSIACLLTTPIALAVAAAIVVWGVVADIEVAVVVSRRRAGGARGQCVIASARTTPRKAARGAARGAAGALALARTAGAAGAETARRTVARWADAAGATVTDVAGPAFGAACTLALAIAIPWFALAGSGAGAFALVGLALLTWAVETPGPSPAARRL